MPLRRIGSVLIVLIGFNAFLDTFFSFERGNFTVRLVPYAFKSLQVLLMLMIVFYFLGQRALRIKIQPLFWLLGLLIGDMAVSVVYAQDTVNPTDLARMIFWVLAAFSAYLLRQADVLDEKVLFRMVAFNLGWVCLRILAYKLFHIWIGAEVRDEETGGFDNDGVINNLGYSLVWLVPLFLLFESKIRFPVLLIVLFSMVAAFKRGALLGLVLGFLVYYFLNRRVPGREKGGLAFDLVRGLSVLGLGGAGFLAFKEHILARMEDVGGDKSLGSGRGIFYQIVLDHWERFIGMKKIIGAGFFQVMPMLGLYYENAIPAHSDWLETLYDQGIAGVAILALIHGTLAFKVLEAVVKKREWGPHLAYSYVIFFLASVYSITLYTFDTTWFGLSLGYYLGTDILSKRKRAQEPAPAPAGEEPGLSPAGAYPSSGAP
jgi:hypothetical protein